MKRDKIYISGPVSGRPFELAMHHFTLAEAKLQAQGYRTCNPLNMRLCVWLAQHGHYRLCLWIQLLWMSATCQCIYLLTSFTKNAALTIGVAAGQPPKRVIAACKDIFDKKDYAEEALTMMAALQAKKIEKNGGVADLSDAIDSVEEITRKLDEQN